jgi:hypothetical protein
MRRTEMLKQHEGMYYHSKTFGVSIELGRWNTNGWEFTHYDEDAQKLIEVRYFGEDYEAALRYFDKHHIALHDDAAAT